jgi:hypothetical protein
MTGLEGVEERLDGSLIVWPLEYKSIKNILKTDNPDCIACSKSRIPLTDPSTVTARFLQIISSSI